MSFTYPWIPDRNDGTYTNPVLHADYSDPDVIRHGDDFYLIASSFHCTPGIPVLHSRDLVNWTLINHAVKNLPHPRYAQVQPGCGIWAPSLRYHNNRFWIFFPMPDEGVFVTTAADPRGTWSEPWLLRAAKGWIDPCPFWDDDGRAYLAHAYAQSRAGIRDKIHLRPMAPDATHLLGEGSIVIDAPHHPFLEGPKIHKRNGWYYILAPGGGVTNGWQVAFRSRHIQGPYEERIVLEQGASEINGPHQGALVETGGEWWFLHFQDRGAYGRIVHLQPVTWQNDWPLIGVDQDQNGVGEPVAGWKKPATAGSSSVQIPATTDEFDREQLGLQWQWQANHDPAWYSLTERPGFLVLNSQFVPDVPLARYPAFLAQKFPAESFSVETQLQFEPQAEGELAGMGFVGGGTQALIALENAVDGPVVILQVGETILARVLIGASQVRFFAEIDAKAQVKFGYARVDQPCIWFADLCQASAGGWIGAKIGIFCWTPGRAPGGRAFFNCFRFAPLTS